MVLFIIVDFGFRDDDDATKTEIVFVFNTDYGSFVRQVLISLAIFRFLPIPPKGIWTWRILTVIDLSDLNASFDWMTLSISANIRSTVNLSRGINGNEIDYSSWEECMINLTYLGTSLPFCPNLPPAVRDAVRHADPFFTLIRSSH